MGPSGGGFPVGQPRAIVLDGTTTWLWWGRTPDDTGDAVAVDASRRRALTWATREDALAAAPEHGWSLAVQDERVGAEEVTDLTPAQEWLRGRRLALPTGPVLALWGWAGDVAASTGGTPWADRGVVRDRCYRKLVAAEVPVLFDLEGYRPSWSPRELEVLRAMASDGVHVLRRAVGHVTDRRLRSLPVT